MEDKLISQILNPNNMHKAKQKVVSNKGASGTVTIKEQLGEDAIMLANNATYLDKATFPSSFITAEKYAQ